ncbi:hypothetical protein HK101_004954 [Irineochytrium annulatum]|nr:hypothetical protein HK101_004954 [Irineochytrium annulatum]
MDDMATAGQLGQAGGSSQSNPALLLNFCPIRLRRGTVDNGGFLVNTDEPPGDAGEDFIRADGNCFFRAIAYLFHDNADLHKEVRGNAVFYIRQFPDVFVELDCGLDADVGWRRKGGQAHLSDRDWVYKYAEHISNANVYADFVAVAATALKMNLRIRVWSDIPQYRLIIEPDGDTDPTTVDIYYYSARKHFEIFERDCHGKKGEHFLAGLVNSLIRYATSFVVNIRLHVITHFVRRFKLVIILFIESTGAAISRKRKGEIARSIVSQFVWEEAKERAAAHNRGLLPPQMPHYRRPTDVFAAAGNVRELTKLHVNDNVQQVIDQIERGATLYRGGAAATVLPLCPTNFGKGQHDDQSWRHYYYAHGYIVERTASLLAARAPQPDPAVPSTLVKQGDCWREVKAKTKELQITLSTTASKKIVGATRAAINFRKTERFDAFRHKMLTENPALLR